MIWRSLTLLLMLVCCTSKPDATAPADPADLGPTLSFSGLEGAKHNVPFTVNVTVDGDIAVSSSSDATQALKIILHRCDGAGDSCQEVEEKNATNNSATFDLTLPSGSYTLKAQTTGAATLQGESTFTVGEVDGIQLSFSENSYTVKSGALFDVTIEVSESDKLDAGSHVTLTLLKEDDSSVEGLMQWQAQRKDMQPLGGAIKAEVDTDDGKAEFKDLFIVDDRDVAKLKAVLEHNGSPQEAKTELKPAAAEVTLNDIVLDTTNNNINLKFNPPISTEYGFDLYFFQAGRDQPVVTGPQAGSGMPHHIDSEFAKLNEHCYHIAVRLNGIGKRVAFLYDATRSSSAPSGC